MKKPAVLLLLLVFFALVLAGCKSETPLTAEELAWFQDYTASTQECQGEDGHTYIAATEISCFFTSQYADPRDMDADAFLDYCPVMETLGAEDEEEFRLVQKKLDWRGGGDQLFTLAEMPIPCHRLPRAALNELLTRYAGVTVEEMRADWTAEAFYLPETDCFYTFTSDFGPGSFVPDRGERSGDTVTLWSGERVLTLEKSGEDWLILSHGVAPVESQER